MRKKIGSLQLIIFRRNILDVLYGNLSIVTIQFLFMANWIHIFRCFSFRSKNFHLFRFVEFVVSHNLFFFIFDCFVWICRTLKMVKISVIVSSIESFCYKPDTFNYCILFFETITSWIDFFNFFVVSELSTLKDASILFHSSIKAFLGTFSKNRSNHTN